MTTAKLFVLCGVDGSGKSTLVDEVYRALRNIGINTQVVKKNTKTNVDLLCRYWEGEQDWSNGSFAQLASIASAMDFVSHYEKNIQSLLSEKNIVISDRYSYCYLSYMRSVGTNKDYYPIVENVQYPDKIFYIKVPPEVAIERHYLRGGPTEDETPEVIRKFSTSYDRLFENMEDVVIIDNTQLLESSINNIVNCIVEDLEK